jgi:hypothetical protein
MYDASFRITGTNGIIFGKQVESKKPRQETYEAFDARTWPEKCRVTDTGELYLPPIALKACLCSTAKYAGLRIPGKGTRTYSQPIIRGLQCINNIVLNAGLDDIELMNEPVDAQPGSAKSTRVMRIFPYLAKWAGLGTVRVLDDIITPDVLTEHLGLAGIMTGLGTWRPERGREYGTFIVSDLQITKL